MPNDIKSQFLMVHTCGDYYYNAFSKVYGYSIRLSPKITNKDRTTKTPEEVHSQYIQRNFKIVGNQENVDPYLNSLVQMIEDLQTYIKAYPNLYDSLLRGDQEFLESVKSKVLILYQGIGFTPKYITQDHINWSKDIRSSSSSYIEIA